MSEQVLESYLISLGFKTDENSLRKMAGNLDKAEHSVASHTTGMTRRFLEVQGAITGAFLGISAGILGVVDKAAMADQGFRLLGLRLLMSGTEARKLSMITTALGASLEEIVWDPELHQRALAMSGQIDRLTKSLGPGFEGSMRSIRDVRAEFGRLKIDTEFLGMAFADKLWQKISPGDPAKQLDQWLSDFERKLPGISDKLSGLADGALRDTWHMLQGTGDAAKEAGLAFTNIIGVLSGDKSIESTAFSYDNLAKALEHVEHAAVKAFDAITGAEKVLAEAASGVALYVGGNHAAAAAEFDKARKNLGKGSGAVLGVVPGAASGAALGAALGVPLGPLGIAAGGVIGTGVGAMAGGGAGAFVGKVAKDERTKPYMDDALTEVRALGILETLKTAAGEAFQEGYDWLYQQPDQKAPDPNSLRQKSGTTPAGALNQPAAPSERLFPAVPRPADAIMQPAPPPEPSLVEKLAAAIAQTEAGAEKNSVARRNNNPGNLRSWGDTPIENGFAKFPDWETGMAALRKQIELNIGRGLTLGEFFAGKQGVYSGYAPKTDSNDPAAYAAEVAKRLGIDTTTPLNKIPDPAPPLLPPASTPAKPIAYFRAQPPADDNAPLSMFASYFARSATWPSMANMGPELAASLANMQRPILPQPNATTVHLSNSLGDINVYITEPGANLDDIHRVVSRAVEEKLAHQTQFDLTQLRASY